MNEYIRAIKRKLGIVSPSEEWLKFVGGLENDETNEYET